MIVCTECENAQFLNITKSRMYWDESKRQIQEKHECLRCDTTGKYEAEISLEDGYSKETTYGQIELTEERPTL